MQSSLSKVSFLAILASLVLGRNPRASLVLVNPVLTSQESGLLASLWEPPRQGCTVHLAQDVQTLFSMYVSAFGHQVDLENTYCAPVRLGVTKKATWSSAVSQGFA